MLKQHIPCWFLGIVISCSFFVSCQNATEKEPPIVSEISVPTIDLRAISSDSIQAKDIISITKVQELLVQNTPVILFEVSKKANYNSGHLPNAISIWRPDFSSKSGYKYGGMRASKVEMETFLSEKGVKSTDNIVLYDVKGGCDALRLAWLLRMYGHEKVQVMNGGKAAWQQAGYALSNMPAVIKKPTNYQFENAENTSDIATLADVQAAILDSNTIIVDTREPAEYLGQPFLKKDKLYEWKKGAYINGCIPTAVHLNWSDASDLKGDHRFKCLKDLKHNFEKAGITPDKNIIVYCHSGVRSTHTYFVLKEILGYPNVKNYDGSWIEWSYEYVANQAMEIEQHTSPEENQRLVEQLQ